MTEVPTKDTVTHQDNPDVQGVHRAYYAGFVVVMLCCFSPLKALAYVLPGFFTLALMLAGGVSRNRMFGLLSVIVIVGVFYALIAEEFLVANYVVAIVTYSSFVPVLVIKSSALASRELLQKMLIASAYMVLVQGVVGIIQALNGAAHTGTFSGATGDYVAGTIHPSLTAEYAFSNPMFAVNMALMQLCCMSVPELLGPRRLRYLMVGAVALVLASVLHVLVFLVAAIVIGFALTRVTSADATAQRRSRNRVVLFLVFVVGLSSVAIPGNVLSITNVAQKAFDLDAVDVPRAILLSRMLDELPDDQPLQPYMGLGPGQFSSRASLIMSGVYLGGPDTPKTLPFLSPQSTRLATDYCITLMIAMVDSERDVGSSQQPFFSWLSMYSEAGLLGLILVLWSVAKVLQRVRRRAFEDPSLRLQVALFCAGTLLVVLLGWQANYWETPQAIFVGLLMLKVVYANIMDGSVVAIGSDRSSS